MASPFRRFIELVLDRKSAQKAECDTQASLGRATNTRAAAANLGRIGSAINGVTRMIVQGTAAVAGYALGIFRLTERGGQLLNVQRAFTNVVGDSDAAISKLRKATGGLISDYDLMVGYTKAFSLGAVKNIDEFGEMASVARDLGKALGVDASYAMEQLSLGIARHSPKILDNIGITAKAGDSFATIMQKARERVDQFGVSSGNAADMGQRAVTMFTNLKDAVAKFLAQSDTLSVAFFETANVLETMVLALQAGDLASAKEAFKHVGTILGSTFAASFVDAVKSVVKKLTAEEHPVLLSAMGLAGGASIGAAVGAAAGSFFGGVGAVPGYFIGGLAGSAVGGIVGARRPGMDAIESGARRFVTYAEGVSQEIEETINAESEALDALGRALDARLRARAKAAGGIVTTQTRTEGGPTVDPRSYAEIAGPPPPSDRFRAMGGVNAPSPDSLTPVTDHLNDFQHFFLDNMSTIESAAQVAALGMQDAFEEAFDAITKEGRGAGGALEAVSRGFAVAWTGALAQVAAAKVTENAAKAIEDVANGFAALAGFNPASASLYFKAAAEHAAAATAWAFLGGGAASTASAAGGGASSFRGSDVTGREIDKINTPAPIVNVYVDGIDPRSAKHQRIVYETVAAAQKSAGRNATVNILPRGAR